MLWLGLNAGAPQLLGNENEISSDTGLPSLLQTYFTLQLLIELAVMPVPLVRTLSL